MKEISIIIPSYNGINKLPNLLHALEEQTLQNFEIVIVLDGSTDDSKSYLSNRKSEIKITTIIQPNSGRAATRNNGVKNSNGNIILFLDDDVRPEKNCIKIHYEHHLNNRDSILIGSTPEDETLIQSDIQRYKNHIGKVWYSQIKNYSGRITKKNYFLAAANLSMPKSVFSSLNGFDERLTDAEDYELGLRALDKGVNIFFNHAALAFHDDFITCKSYINRQREYYKARQQLNKIKPSVDKETKRDFLLKKIIFNFFSKKLWVNIVDHFNILIILPKILRYKLYSLIIWGLSTKYPDRKI